MRPPDRDEQANDVTIGVPLRALAVIPARGGSKRIPRKNIRHFCGKPMIHWSIDAALRSGCFERVIVSTDDPEIASLAREAGAEVPFQRPAELSDDHATTSAVVVHAATWAQSAGMRPEAICCIYATAPFIRTKDISEGLALLHSGNWEFVFSATQFEAPVQRAFRLADDRRTTMLFPENFNVRSQDLRPIFHDAAQFYWGRPGAWLSGTPIFQARSTVIEIPRWRSQDIDSPEDWEQAERLASAILSRSMI